VRETILAAMRSDPSHWRKYYHGKGRALELQLEYSLSDRIRYYWPVPAVAQALTRLEASFDTAAPAMALLHEYLPAETAALRAADMKLTARNLLIQHIRRVLSDYSGACSEEQLTHRTKKD
jgi:D-tagatose-1,6-bisphosphate aldolase subunit GatZ/KbaZ